MSVVTLCDRFSSCGFAARSVVAVVSLPAVAVLSLPAVAVPGFAASSATIRSLTDCVFITSMCCRTTGARLQVPTTLLRNLSICRLSILSIGIADNGMFT